MAGITLELDAAGSAIGGGNPPGTALLIVDSANGWNLLQFDNPTAEQDILYASSVDTEGEIVASQRYRNAVVTVRLRIRKSTASLLQAALNSLGEKIGRIAAEGGTLKATLPSTSTYFADLVAGDYRFGFDHRLVKANTAEVTLTLPRQPFWRGAEQDLGDNTETTLPALVFTEASIPGDVPALGRLVIDDDSANDQRWVIWGVQSRYYSNAATAALFYEAEGRTVLGGAATAAGPSGASGAGSNVVRHTSLPSSSYLAILSTQATGGGAHLTHVGEFRVFARVQTSTGNTGTVTVALEWATGDFQSTTVNTAQTLPVEWEGSWRLVDLGQITIRPEATRWEGRVLAKAAVTGDDIDIDYLLFVPVTEGSATAEAVVTAGTATSFAARDEFDQTAGALAGKTLPIGGTWSGAGDTDDFQVSGTGIVQRSTSSDTGARIGIAGTTNYSAIAAQVDVRGNQTGNGMGVVARWTDVNNHVRAGIIFTDSTTATLSMTSVVAGVSTTLGTVTLSNLSLTAWYTVRLLVTAGGDWFAWFYTQNGHIGAPLLGGTGISLAAGEPGIFDFRAQAAGVARDYDNFVAWVPTVDSAIYASQSLEIRHNLARREDSTGAFWQKISRYEGDYLTVPASGQEARTARVLVKACRNDPATIADSAIDDISARLFVTPRYLVLPE